MTDDPKIARAEARVDAAREQLIDTIQDIAHQLEPRRLIGELWQDAKVKGADLAEEAVDAVKARPLAATGIAAAITMFLAREPIMGIAGKMLGGLGHKRAEKKRRKAAPAKAATAKAATRKSPVRKSPTRKPASKAPRPTRSSPTRSSKAKEVQ